MPPKVPGAGRGRKVLGKLVEEQSRYVPERPPKGDMRHMTQHEIRKVPALIQGKFDENACAEELKEIKRCWTLHGSDNQKEKFECQTFEENYVRCMRTNMFNRKEINYSFGGENVYDYMRRFTTPLREPIHDTSQINPNANSHINRNKYIRFLDYGLKDQRKWHFDRQYYRKRGKSYGNW